MVVSKVLLQLLMIRLHRLRCLGAGSKNQSCELVGEVLFQLGILRHVLLSQSVRIMSFPKGRI